MCLYIVIFLNFYLYINMRVTLNNFFKNRSFYFFFVRNLGVQININYLFYYKEINIINLHQ